MSTTVTDGDRLSHVVGVLRSELCKLFSVRSTLCALVAAVWCNVVVAALAAIFIPDALSVKDRAGIDSIRLSLAGIHLSQIAFGALGALVITGEYGSGMVRATFAAVPRRRLVLAGKAIVFAGTALIVGVVSSYAAYFTFQVLVSDDSLRSSLGDPGVLRAVTGGGAYLAVLGLLGLGLGALIRSSAGTIAALFGLLFVPSILVNLLPHSWQTSVGPYLPMEAGSGIFVASHPDAGSLGPWAGFGVFSLYAAIALAGGFFVISRRDA